MNSSYILLWLESPLQSWGADSKFGRRDTLPFPTKSGIMGLVCCALGASGEQKDLLSRMAPLSQTVISYVRAIKQSDGEVKKRVREPLLMDFHMVGSGYDDKHPWEKYHIPKTSQGKAAVGGGTKITYRYYLQDAIFAVILEVPRDLAKTFSMALQNPVYNIFLGRKSCIPTEFVYQGIFDHDGAAEQKAFELMQEKNLIEDYRVLEGEHEGDAMTLNDVPMQFGSIKKYRDRRVTVVYS